MIKAFVNDKEGLNATGLAYVSRGVRFF